MNFNDFLSLLFIGFIFIMLTIIFFQSFFKIFNNFFDKEDGLKIDFMDK